MIHFRVPSFSDIILLTREPECRVTSTELTPPVNMEGGKC